MKTVRTLCVHILFFALSTAVYATQFPQPTGHVNDFANVIPQNVRITMESSLRDYAQKTSIEIAVVTIPSLNDMDVGDYAVQLGNSWGVGNKRKDNGVIFLIAPNDRKVFIATGYGVEPDMPDGACGHILDTAVVPSFKAGNVAQGIINGTTAIMQHLGDTSYDQRIVDRRERARLVAEEETRKEAERVVSHEHMMANMREILFFLAVFFIVASPFCVVAVFVIRRKRYRAECEKQRAQNKRIASECKESFSALKQSLQEADETLRALKDSSPKSVWGEAEATIASFLPLSQKPFDSIVGHSVGAIGTAKMLDQLATEARAIVRAKSEVESALGAIRMVVSLRGDLETSRTRAPLEYKNVVERREELVKLSAHEDVSLETRRIAERALKGAHNCVLPDANAKENWIRIVSTLGVIYASLHGAIGKARKEIDFAKQARSDGPGLLKSLPEQLQEAQRAIGRTDVGRVAKGHYAAAQKSYDVAATRVRGNTDWVFVFGMLLQSADGAQRAIHQASEDVREAAAERERQKVAARRRREEEEDRRRRSSSSSVSISSSGSRGGGFGGFSGGSFGGGGAGRSW